MDIPDIKDLLTSEDPQLRLRGLVALKDYEADTAVPLLVAQRQDEAFLVRSFVAMGLGRKQNETAYAALLEMLPVESDQNVKAEIANSLGLYGERSVSCLVELFHANKHWLVRRSILAIMPELNCSDQLLEVALVALEDPDETIVHAGIMALGTLAKTPQANAALSALLPVLKAQSWRSRMYLVHALKNFQTSEADTALRQLSQDPHHKVVAATLENLLPS